MKLAFLVGRITFGSFFLYNVNHFKEREALAQYAAAKKVPAPDVAIIASGAVLTACASSCAGN
jgi:putative oxidoreductase